MKKLIGMKGNYWIESSAQRVLEVFFVNPEKEFSLTEVAKIARVKKSNINKILKKLEKRGLINITYLRKLWRISASIKNQNFIRNKIIYNLGLVYESGIIDFLTNYSGNPKSIILFGSFRKGDDISTSDIDVAVEKEDIIEYEAKKAKELEHFEKVLKRRIQIHYFNTKKTDKNVLNNIINGIVLYGFLEIK